MEEVTKLTGILEEGGKMLSTTDLVVDAFKDLVKEEIKDRIRERIDENPELKKEIKAAVTLYLDAKANEMYASFRLAKCGARLGLDMMPEQVRDKMLREFTAMFEKEMAEIFENAL